MLQHPQKPGLRLHRHLADLIEEEGASLGLLTAPGGTLIGASERPFFVAEQFALDEIAGNCRHVDGDERAFLAFAIVMQRARDKLLAGAGFASDHDREIGLHQARQSTVDFLHGGGAPHEMHPLQLRIGRGADAILAHRAQDDRNQLPQVERLRQIIIGAALGRLDRGYEGILRAHDDDRQIGPFSSWAAARRHFHPA